jgi:nicotinate phosphoribosyltransferase
MHTASPDQIKRGEVTDVYFARTVEVLRKAGIERHVAMEVRAASLPPGCEWAVFAGLDEALEILEGVPVDVEAMPEGTIFRAGEPVVFISGPYTQFGVYETAILGTLCQASGVATKAARCKMAAAGRTVISFGARRMHPALAPMIERAAYLGGCDGVAVVASAEQLGIKPSGTMPHALVLCVGDPVEAFRLFDRHVDPSVPRVALVDTVCDEKQEAIRAAEALGERLSAVRLDTPGSRRGDMLAIAQEVRWELDLRGYNHVGIFISGGLDEYNIPALNPVANGYGVGTAISNAPVINFAADIVEIEGKPVAKRGKWSGRKQVLACPTCGSRRIVPAGRQQRCECGGEMTGVLETWLRKGALSQPPPPPAAIRERVLKQLERLSLTAPRQ